MKKKVLLLIALLLPLMACAQVTKVKEEADTLNEKAYEYAYEGNYEAAIATIDKAIELCPEDPNYYDSKGEILFNKGDKDGAKTMWDKVISLDPNFGEKKTALYVFMFTPEIIEEHDSDIKVFEDITDKLWRRAKGEDVKIEDEEYTIADERLEKIGKEFGQYTFNQKNRVIKANEKLKEQGKLRAERDSIEQKRLHGSYWFDYDNWKFNFPNGHYLLRHGDSNSETKDFEIRQNETNFYIDKNDFDTFIDNNAICCLSKISLTPKDVERFKSLSKKEQSDLIQENLKYLNLYNKDGLKITIRITSGRFSDWDNNTLGFFENSKYKSMEDIAAEEDKAWKAAVAPYTKRFGFNPSEKSAKQLITYGRSFSLLKDWYYFLRDHDYTYYFFNIHEDRGSVKCYGIFYDKNLSNRGKKVGYIWVAGGKITSVKWL